MIPVYEPTELLAETLRSVRDAIAYAPGAFQVELVDDASPSARRLEDWIPEGLAAASHRRPVNGGLGECWNECIARARGELIHILHQDDLIAPDFYSRIDALAHDFPTAGMLFCRTVSRHGEKRTLGPVEQDHAGLLPGWLETISAGQRLFCPAVVVRRDTYRQVGGYDVRLKFVIDWEMWIRIAARYPVAYTPQALVEYRVHEQSETSRLRSRGCITDDLALAHRAIAASLPGRDGKANLIRALWFLVWCSWDAAASAERAGRIGAARSEAWAALRHWAFAMRPKQSWRLVKLLLRTSGHRATAAAADPPSRGPVPDGEKPG